MPADFIKVTVDGNEVTALLVYPVSGGGGAGGAVYGPDAAGAPPTQPPILMGGYNTLDDLVVRLRASDTGELYVLNLPAGVYRPAQATTGAAALAAGADTDVVPANGSRYRITLVNPDPTNTIILAVGAAASTAAGYYLLPLASVVFETQAKIVAKSVAGTPTVRWVEEY